MKFSAVEDLLWYLNIAATGFLVFRLIQQDLWRLYHFLFLYLLFDTMLQLVSVAVRGMSANPGVAYFAVYSGGQAVKLVLAVFVVLELYKLALVRHPAISSFGQKVAGYILLAASALAMAQLALSPPRISLGWNLTVRQYLWAVERTVDLAILLLLLSAIAFLLWFPVQVAKNYAYYLGGFSAYFLARWLGFFVLNNNPQFRSVVSAGELVVSLVCVAGMAFTMRQGGEQETIVPGHSWNAAEMKRLANQLEAINASLARHERRL